MPVGGQLINGFSLTLTRSLTSASQLQFSVMTFPTFLNRGNNFIAWQETHDSLNICSRASLQHSRECLPFTAFPTSRKIEYSLCFYLKARRYKEIIKTAVAAKVSEPEFMSNSHNMTRSTILQSGNKWLRGVSKSGSCVLGTASLRRFQRHSTTHIHLSTLKRPAF